MPRRLIPACALPCCSEEQDVPEYPLAEAHEAVANAVAHRDYAAPAPIFVRLYEDGWKFKTLAACCPG